MGVRPHALALGLLLSACSSTPRTEVILWVSTDYAVPTEMDAFTATVAAPDMEIQTASALLSGPSDQPATLGLLHRDGPLGSFEVTIQGTSGGMSVTSRRARFSFQEGRTLVLRVHLSRACEMVRCVGDETCEDGVCRNIQVGPDELEAWPLPDGMDASVDAPMDGGVDSATDAATDSTVGDSMPLDADGAMDGATLPTCDDLFSDQVAYFSCEERAAECEFFTDPGLMASCAIICDLAGETCIRASAPSGVSGRSRCNPAATTTCDTTADQLLCVCSRTPR